jgi:hypothetical protein
MIEGTSEGSEGAASVGQDDQQRERDMEEQQRREDDGIGVPPEANPHVPNDGLRPGSSAYKQSVSPDERNSHKPAEGTSDHGDSSGQAPDELGGLGPVQP